MRRKRALDAEIVMSSSRAHVTHRNPDHEAIDAIAHFPAGRGD
jgi:hypothetical protein